MVTATIDAGDEWLHSFYYYNDELPTEEDFANTVADYLTFEFNMIAHGRGYLFDDEKKNFPPLTDPPPLLDEKPWAEFFITDVADIVSGRDINATEQIAGKIPYVSSTSINNGIYNFVDNRNETIETNCISVNRTGSVGYAFYHPYAALYSNNVRKLRLNIANNHVAFFIVNQIMAQREKYNYGYILGTVRLKRQKIFLPVMDDGAPDYDYMAAYVRAVEEKILQRYHEFLIAPPPVKTLPLNEKPWRSFFISDVAEILSGRDIYEDERKAGNNPYIGASANNNGVCHFVSNENETLEENCISVNRNGSVGYAFFHPYAALYSNDCRKLRPYVQNEFVALFIAQQVTAQRGKYSYGYKMGTGRLKRQKIMLPVDDDGAPDFDYMAAYVKNKFAETLRLILDRWYE